MENIEITLQNYRAFPNHAPVTFQMTEGISFLLGVNNVGKSAFLRSFFELRDLLNLNTLKHQPQELKWAHSVNSRFHFDQLVNRSTPNLPICLKVKIGSNKFKFEFKPSADDPHTTTFTTTITVEEKVDSRKFITDIESLYMGSMYIGSFRSPAVQVNDSVYDVQIGRQFIQQWDSWANGERVDHSTQIDALVEELRNLFGFQRLSISVSKNKDQLYLTSEEGRFALSELGDGIAHHIIVLGNAMIKSPTFILIDEPEIGLHPRMQETFVRTLASKAQLGLFATSHSIGLARSVSDRIITVTKGKR